MLCWCLLPLVLCGMGVVVDWSHPEYVAWVLYVVWYIQNVRVSAGEPSDQRLTHTDGLTNPPSTNRPKKRWACRHHPVIVASKSQWVASSNRMLVRLGEMPLWWYLYRGKPCSWATVHNAIFFDTGRDQDQDQYQRSPVLPPASHRPPRHLLWSRPAARGQDPGVLHTITQARLPPAGAPAASPSVFQQFISFSFACVVLCIQEREDWIKRTFTDI